MTSFAEIQVRSLMRVFKFPQILSLLNVHNFAVNAWSSAHKMHMNAIGNRIRVEKIKLVNAKRDNDQEKASICEARIEALELLEADMLRIG